jgi:hypothetical protein
MFSLVDEAQGILTTDYDLGDYVRFFHEYPDPGLWLAADISTGTIDEFFARAMKACLSGYKLPGAGGAFIIFYAGPGKHHAVRNALSDFMIVQLESVEYDSLTSIACSGNMSGENGLKRQIAGIAVMEESIASL